MHLEELTYEVGIPEGVTAVLEGTVLTAKGPKGEVTKKVGSKLFDTKIDGSKIIFTKKNATRREKRLMKSGLAHATNLLRGVVEGHVYKLKICSGHFPMTVAIKDGKIEVKNFIGEKVPRVLELKKDCDVKIDGQEIVVESASKEVAGHQASDIERLTRRPGFDSRIFQDGIYITVKDGKDV